MKQRITYLVKDPDSFTPEKLNVKDGSLTLNGVEAVKEHRLTFSLDELPAVLKKSLRQWHELHIKWASPEPHTAIPPFTSRVTPGLHVFFEPQETQPIDQFCDLLHAAFDLGLKCSSTQEAATTLAYLSERSRPDTSLQYYSYLPTLTQLVSYIRKNICSSSSKTCKERAESLLGVSYLDIDYDSTAAKVVLTAFWESPPKEPIWTDHITALTGEQTVEVGVLTHEPNPDPEDIAFGGFLTVLGRDTAPNKYQFTDALFLASHNLAALRQISGATDLEAPDWVVPQWGSSALFELAFPSTEGDIGGQWNVSIPMHLRYLPAAARSHARVPVPWPVVFWACDAEQELTGNPFDRVNLGYEVSFGRETRFMHLAPAEKGNGTGELVEWIDVPVLDTRGTGWVEVGTIGIVMLAFLGLCWVLFGGAGKKAANGEQEKKKQ
ncbi:protease B nonderepressible form [Kalmusia sp. IMI 367209]|nr:protease B nonderepressible form [Kalmusia sp. IMI 367209]